jgi:hypothetical protein
MWAHRSRRRILELSVTVFWLANAALVASPSAGTDPTSRVGDRTTGDAIVTLAYSV